MKGSLLQRSLCALALCALTGLATAEQNPPPGVSDARVRTVDYNPAQVVRVTAFYGVSTHIQFAADEQVREVSVGDEGAWFVVPRGRHLFLKPKARQADTNATVVTDRRVYHFVLVVSQRNERDTQAWQDPSLLYSLSFRYPEDEAALEAARQREAQARLAQETVAANLGSAGRRGDNDDYWVAGSVDIAPTEARDDARFTYLTFGGNRDMPAIYAVDESGAESLINTSVEGNVVVVHWVGRMLRLRKGAAVACVLNRGFEASSGRDNTTGTVSDKVGRVVKTEGGRP
jgi:type IV secretion system protein VirB9